MEEGAASFTHQHPPSCFGIFCLSSNYIPILKKLSKNDFFHMQTMSWTGPLTPDEYNDTMVTGLSSSAN